MGIKFDHGMSMGLVWLEHESIATCRKLHTEPIDLDYCLKAFTSEERLETKYHCSKCQDKQPATKKLQIWRLPPILIVHLKRFDYVNSKWVKTQKVVNFPFKNFDPTAYLASVPQETILRHHELLLKRQKVESDIQAVLENGVCEEDELRDSSDSGVIVSSDDGVCSETSRLVDDGGDSKSVTFNCITTKADKPTGQDKSFNKVRERLISTSLQKTPILDENLHDFHEHNLLEGQDIFDLKYQLYAVVSHSGLLNGGHYVSYGCNPNGHWYCYNDSSCREVPVESSTSSTETLHSEAATTTATNNNNNSNEYKYGGNKYQLKISKSANTTPIIRRKNYDVTSKSTDVESISLNGVSGVNKIGSTNGFNLDDAESKSSATESCDDSKSSLNTFKCTYSDVKIPKIDTSNAYILFYERSGLNYKPYLPEVVINGQIVPEVELEENESELRKQLCSIQ